MITKKNKIFIHKKINLKNWQIFHKKNKIIEN